MGTYSSALSFYSILACHLLGLMYAARYFPLAKSTDYFSEVELQVLGTATGGNVETVAGAVLALGKMAGWKPSKWIPMPGVKSLWTGLLVLSPMVYFCKVVNYVFDST